MGIKAWNPLEDDPALKELAESPVTQSQVNWAQAAGSNQATINTLKGKMAAGKGNWFSKANAPKTADVASALQIGFSALSKLFSKEKKGQPGVSNAGNLGNQLQAGSHDWMKFFT